MAASDGQPVRIIQFEDGPPNSKRKILLDENALNEILNNVEVKDLPVVVLSVAGAFRKGKSFLLNFCLRYLRALSESKSDVSNWMGSDSEPLEGFEWAYGSKRNTTGIIIWSKPFIVTSKLGQKLAVLVMDTQGVFDNQSTIRENTCVFALSTLLSSIQVYNVSQQLQEDHLKILSMFTEFAKHAKEDVDSTVFQRLVFLIRDWQFKEEHAYGSTGGGKYFDEYMKTNEKNTEIQEVRTMIKEAYGQLSCFLLPHPGFEVDEPTFDGRLSVLRDVFKNHVKDLIEFLLAPESVVSKKIVWELSASQWSQYLRSYVETLNNYDNDNLGLALHSASVNLANEMVVMRFYRSYNEKLTQLNYPVKLEEMRLFHDEAKNATLREFNNQNHHRFGGPEVFAKFSNKLAVEIEKRFAYLKALNRNMILSSLAPLQLIARKDNGMHVTDRVIDSIPEFSNVKDLPIVVLSIAGPPSRSKTNLLNIILRYLQCLSEDDVVDDWMTREKMPLVGFDDDTQKTEPYITIWPQPFVIGESKKLAVLLMNVSEIAVGNAASMITLASLTSSIQVTLDNEALMRSLQTTMESEEFRDKFQHQFGYSSGVSVLEESFNEKFVMTFNQEQSAATSTRCWEFVEAIQRFERTLRGFRNYQDGTEQSDCRQLFNGRSIFEELESLPAGYNVGNWFECLPGYVAQFKDQQVRKKSKLSSRLKKAVAVVSWQDKFKGFIQSLPVVFSNQSQHMPEMSYISHVAIKCAFDAAIKVYTDKMESRLNLNDEKKGPDRPNPVEHSRVKNDAVGRFKEELGTFASSSIIAMLEQKMNKFFSYHKAYYYNHQLQSASPVTIVGFENSRVQSHGRALQDMVERLNENERNLPIVVLSVAGTARKGKSFILNFCLRYLLTLETEGQVTDDWLGPDDVPLVGFEWKSSSVGVTSGIVMWPRPFIVKKTNGQKVAVFVMDTQGTFDNREGTSDTPAVFTLSTLMSSVLVNNISSRIQSDDLQNLSVFTNYAQLSENNSAMERFQRLLFLVRNWQDPDEYCYGEKGGESYLHDQVLNVKPDEMAEVLQVKEQIREAFEQVQCFLMPYPGNAVATRKQFDGNLSDIDKDFKTELKKLVPYLLSPSCLNVKKFGGETVTVRQWLEHIDPYLTAMVDRGPDNFSIYEVQAELQHREAERSALEAYVNMMNAALDRPDADYLWPKDFQELDKISREFAIGLFGRIPKLGQAAFTRERQRCLSMELQRQFTTSMEPKNKQRYTWWVWCKGYWPWFLAGGCLVAVCAGVAAVALGSLPAAAAAGITAEQLQAAGVAAIASLPALAQYLRALLQRPI